MNNHESDHDAPSAHGAVQAVGQAGGRPNAKQLFALALLLVLLPGAAQGQILVEDGFEGAAGAPPDATKFEWSGDVSHDGSGSLNFGTWSVNTSWLQSRTGAVVSAGSTLRLRFRASAYAEGWIPGIYGDGQPRGLRVGNDANNVIEFYSAANSTVGMRVRSGGAGSEQTYAITPGVASMHLYEISVTTTAAVFSVDGAVAATFTANLPTGALDFYVATFDGYAGNVPVSLDSLSLTLTNDLAAPLDFTYTTNAGAITITGYTGPGGAVSIPATVNGLPVTDIGQSAFCFQSGLTSTTIPDSVTNIGSWAFAYCSGLTHITIGRGLGSIGYQAFTSCPDLSAFTVDALNSSFRSQDGVLFNGGQTRLIQYPAGKAGYYSIPGTVTNITWQAFGNCVNLTGITIPDSVTTIDGQAFCSCTSLSEVTIPDTVSGTLYQTFLWCSGLTNAIVGDGVTNLEGTFSDCPSLTGAAIGSSVTNLAGAFVRCTGLKSIQIPAGVTALGEMAFADCSGLTNLAIPASVTNIGNNAFSGCSALTSLVIPDSVADMGSYAFAHCSGLTNVALGVGLTRIGSDAFYSCVSLTAILIPDSVRSVGSSAFSQCHNLALAVIGNGVTNLGVGAFCYCHSLTNVIIGCSAARLEDMAFYDCANLGAVCFHGNAPEVGVSVFAKDTHATVYHLPQATGWPPVPDLWAGRPTALWSPLYELTVSGGAGGGSYTNGAQVTIIASNAPDGQVFDRWTGATQHVASVRAETSVVTMPAQDISVAAAWRTNCFTHTTNTGKITITGYTGSGGAEVVPDTINGWPVTHIGNNAFSYIGSLTDVTIGNNVTTLGNNAFYRCDNMTNITFGHSVNTIGSWALYGGSFRAISVTGLNPFYSSVDGVLFNKPRTSVIRCPNARSGSFSIPDGTTSIGPEAFSWCGGLTNVTIPNGVLSIGYYAFMQSGLADIHIPASVTSIQTLAFRNCGNMKWISVDPLNPAYCSVDGVLFNKNRTVLIKYPEARTGGSYSVPDSVISIENNAFSYCYGLVNVTMGRNVTAIADYGLYYCLSLRGVFFKGNPPSLGGSYVFTGDHSATVYCLAGTTGWGESFGGRPAVLWNPQAQTGGAGFGVRTNGFGFNITGTAGIPIVVEACADLAAGVWITLQSGTLTNGSFNFSDPQWTNHPSRVYRIRSP